MEHPSGGFGGRDGQASEALLVAMESNLAGHMADVPALLPGATVWREPDLVLVDSGVPSDTFNVVCGARFAAESADERIAAAIGHFAARELPFAWWVGPASRPDDLGERLIAHGLVATEASVAMALDLGRLPGRPALPAGLTVRRVSTPTELADFARIVAANWEPPDPNVIEFYERAAAVVLAPDFPDRFYIGYLDGEPVATSEGFFGGGVVGVYGVCTLEGFRRRGFGTALTLAPLLDGRDEGYRAAVLQASEDGQKVYARLGFVGCGEFREYHPANSLTKASECDV